MRGYGKTDVAKQYREKYGQKMPTLKLARIMHKENSIMFSSVEDARSFLRSIEGKGWHPKSTDKLPDRPRNPYNLPDSDEKEWLPYLIDKGRVLVLSDIHIPYHSTNALTLCLNYAKDQKPDIVFLNGDILDFYQLSRYIRDPKARSFADELRAFKRFFEALQTIFGARIIYKLGNHEERYDHFLYMKAHELDGVEEFSLENILKARAEGITIIKDKRIVMMGDLCVLHGHEFGGSFFSPVNVARGLFLRGKVSALQGHSHQTSEHTEQNMRGEITTTFSTGCLCNLTPQWLPINKWNHGFAIVDVSGRDFLVRNHRIDKDMVK